MEREAKFFDSFKEYDDWRKTMAVYPRTEELGGLAYCGLKIAGEAGEIADKIGKVMRDDNFVVTTSKRHAMLLELGDILWYVSAIAHELGSDLPTVAQMNYVKLMDRQDRNKLQGEGDYR